MIIYQDPKHGNVFMMNPLPFQMTMRRTVSPFPLSQNMRRQSCHTQFSGYRTDIFHIQTDQAENFAQEFVISLFANVVDGGIGTIQPNWKAIYPMYSTIQQLFGDSVKPGGTCTTRIVNE